MQLQFGTSLLTGLLITAPLMHAQTADVVGHWAGTIQIPGMELSIEVDLARDQPGGLTGTISVPEQNLKGLPLQTVTLENRSVAFKARTDQTFEGLLSPDGNSISGNLSFNGFFIPFAMTRTGEPRIAPPAKLPPIAHELEGTWEGTAEFESGSLRLVLAMSNQPDGAAVASVVNLDEGSLRVPVSAIAYRASTVTLDLDIVGGSYTGVLNGPGTEIAGTYKQGAIAAPVVFRKSAAAK